MSTDREALRLQDIIDNIDRIGGYIAGLELGTFATDDKKPKPSSSSVPSGWLKYHPRRLPKLRADCVSVLGQ